MLEPTAADKQEMRFEDAVLQARNDPAPAEVQSGKALNVLLTDLRRLDDQGVALADVGLDPAVLGRIHVVASGDGDVGPALVLQNPLPWPESLSTADFAADRARVEAALEVARAEAAEGPVARNACQDVLNAVDRMDRGVTAKIRSKQDWPDSDAIEAGTFVTRLKTSAAVLRQPDVSGYLNGAYAAKGKTVLELVHSMGSNGLHFAPRCPATRRPTGSSSRRWRAATPGPMRRPNDATEKRSADEEDKYPPCRPGRRSGCYNTKAGTAGDDEHEAADRVPKRRGGHRRGGCALPGPFAGRPSAVDTRTARGRR